MTDYSNEDGTLEILRESKEFKKTTGNLERLVINVLATRKIIRQIEDGKKFNNIPEINKHVLIVGYNKVIEKSLKEIGRETVNFLRHEFEQTPYEKQLGDV